MHGYDLELMANAMAAQQAAQSQSLAEIHRRQQMSALQGMAHNHSPFPTHCHGMLAGAAWSPQDQEILDSRCTVSADELRQVRDRYGFKPATFREELQQEIDEWLKI